MTDPKPDVRVPGISITKEHLTEADRAALYPTVPVDHPAVDLIDQHLMVATPYYGRDDARALADALTAAGWLPPAGVDVVKARSLAAALDRIDQAHLRHGSPHGQYHGYGRALLDALGEAGQAVTDRPDVLRTVVRPALVDVIARIDAALGATACRCEDPEGRRWDHPHGTGLVCRPADHRTDRHTLTIEGDHTWTIDHPDECLRMTPTGPALVCNVEDLAREQLTGIRWTPGRYEVDANDVGDRLLFGDRLHDDQCTAPVCAACGCWCHDDEPAAEQLADLADALAVLRDPTAGQVLDRATLRAMAGRPTPHLNAVKAELERTERERNLLVDAIGRMISMPPRDVAKAYCVRYGTAAPGPEPVPAGADEQPADPAETYCYCKGGGKSRHRYGSGPVCGAVRKADARRAELAEVGRQWIAERESSPAHDHADGFPLFAPAASVGVHTSDGFETWTGAQWNAHVRAATRGGNSVPERLAACPDTVCTTTCPAAGPEPVSTPAASWQTSPGTPTGPTVYATHGTRPA